MSTDVEISTEFRCPQCASNRFGSMQWPNRPAEYYCKGHDDGRMRCAHQFQCEEEDLWKYMLRVERRPFASREECEAVERER